MKDNKTLFVCSRNGEPGTCKIENCRLRITHRVEVLARPDKVPACETHKQALVRA